MKRSLLILTAAVWCAVVNSAALATELLYLPLDQVNGSGPFTTPDATGRGNDGTLVSRDSTDLEGGIIGKSLNFNTNQPQAIDIPASNPDVNQAYTAFTFDAWLAPRNATPSGDEWIAGKMGGGGNRGWQIELTGSSDSGGANQLNIDWFDGPSGNEQAVYLGFNPFHVNQWTNIAITFQGGSSVNMYINGVLQLTAPTSLATLNGVTTNPFEVGNRGPGGPGSWNGFIDEVHLFDTALTGAQVQSLMQVNAPALGDLNNDGHVNLTDYGILKSHWLQGSVGLLNGDMNSDNTVNMFDFEAFRQAYVAAGGNSSDLTMPVPEPATWALAVAAAPAWLFVRRCKRKVN